MTKEQEMLIKEVYRRCRQSQHFNYQASHYYLKKNNRLVGITILFSCLASSAISYRIIQYFTSTQSSYSLHITYAAGALSVFVTVLSILQMIFNYSELSERCSRASARYGFIRRELELLMSQKTISDSELSNRMSDINYVMTCLAEDAPLIPEKTQKKVKKELESDHILHPLFSDCDEKNGS